MSVFSKAPWTSMCLAAICLSACGTYSNARQGMAPYSPQYGHEYRHGAVPTREAMEKMRAWKTSKRPMQPALAANPQLAFGGGVDSIGITRGVPQVYLVFYGSQWATRGDPNKAASFLQALFTGIGTDDGTWSGTMTQYCDGPSVSVGATGCNPATTPHVGYPSSGALAGVWFDASADSPKSATKMQLAQEAIKAAAHFGNTRPADNRSAQYIIVSPTGAHPDGFNTTSANFCGWHDYTPSPYGDIAYTNLPYVSDAGKSCGANFINAGTAGILDAFSIVGGHEYAETVTDQNPPGGWTNPVTGEESADECSWISSGQGAVTNVYMVTGTFAMQSVWSNDTNRCEISHAILGNPILLGRDDEVMTDPPGKGLMLLRAR